MSHALPTLYLQSQLSGALIGGEKHDGPHIKRAIARLHFIWKMNALALGFRFEDAGMTAF